LSKHFSAYRTQPSKIDYVARNLKRVAEVWLDDYKKYLYRGSPARFERVDVGDLTKQFELKASLKCKPFKYFLDIVAPDMIMRFPILPIYFASGNIQSEFKDSKGNQKCVGLVHHVYDESITLVDCPKVGSFDFALTLEKSIRLNDTNDQCLSWHNLSLGNCNHQGWDQYFKFDVKSRQIINMEKKKCLQGNIVTSKITLESCDENVIFQRWKWSFENTTALENFDENGIVYPK
jgi:polypeptide N-acetylgalactosaminyltransferase